VKWSDPIFAQTDKDYRALPVLDNYYGDIGISHFSQNVSQFTL